MSLINHRKFYTQVHTKTHTFIHRHRFKDAGPRGKCRPGHCHYKKRKDELRLGLPERGIDINQQISAKIFAAAARKIR